MIKIIPFYFNLFSCLSNTVQNGKANHGADLDLPITSSTSSGSINRKNNNNNIPSAALPVSKSIEDTITNTFIQYTNCNWDLNSINIDTTAKKEIFQNDPGLYCVLFGTKKNEINESIISFAYVDCSVLAVEGGILTGRSQAVHGLLFEITISVAKPFFEKDQIYDQEILSLDFKR